MAHSTNIISQIKLPNGTTYDIHDSQAIHSIEELGLSAALVFKGTKEKGSGSTSGAAQILALTSAKVGDVWLDKDTNTEYVCVKALSGTADATAWEKMGNIHDAASTTHTHSFSKTVSIPAVNVTGSVTVPTVSATSSNKLSATASAPTVTPTTTTITASASGTAVAANGTANAITGFGTHTTDSALGTGATFAVSGGDASTSKMVTTTIKNPTVTAVTIPNVTGNTSVTASKVKTAGSNGSKGSAANWEASVSNGVLSFTWTANTPTTPSTIPTFDSVTASNTTLGTALSASSVSTQNVTVATGSLASTGTGSAVVTGVSDISVAVDNADTVTAITALGTPTTAKALTGVKVSAQPTITVANGENVMTGVTVAAPTVTVKSGTTGDVAYVSAVSVGSTTANLTSGKTTAQNVTVSGSTGQPQ